MLDPAYVREHLEDVRTGLRNRGLDADAILEPFASLDARRREQILEVEGLKREQNAAGEEVARAKKQGLDPSGVFAANKARALQIKQLEAALEDVEQKRTDLLMTVPNLPHASVPVGKSAGDNVEVRRHGAPRTFDFDPRPHWDIGTELGILDFERAAKMSGARFSVLMGAGARLARALINFMLELHTREHGYTEVEPPFLVNTDALRGTGNLPNFEQDPLRIAGGGVLFLGTSAAAPLSSFYRRQLPGVRVRPLRCTAYTPCVCSGAGS